MNVGDEKLYLNCIACGEVFDSLDAAKEHESREDDSFMCEGAVYGIQPESEAF